MQSPPPPPYPPSVEEYYKELLKEMKEKRREDITKEVPDWIYYPIIFILSFYAAWGGIPINYFELVIPFIVFFSLIFLPLAILRGKDIARRASGGDHELRKEYERKWSIGNVLSRIIIASFVAFVSMTYLYPWMAAARAYTSYIFLIILGIYILIFPSLAGRVEYEKLLGRRKKWGIKRVRGWLERSREEISTVYERFKIFFLIIGFALVGIGGYFLYSAGGFSLMVIIPFILLILIVSILYVYLGISDLKYGLPKKTGGAVPALLYLSILLFTFLILTGSIAIGAMSAPAPQVGGPFATGYGIGYPLFGVLGGMIFTFIFYSIFGAIIPKGWVSFFLSLVPTFILIFWIFPAILPIINIQIQPILPVIGWKIGWTWSLSWSLADLYKTLDYRKYLEQVQAQYETLWCDVYGIECKGSTPELMPTSGVRISEFKSYGATYCGKNFSVIAKIENIANYPIQIQASLINPYSQWMADWLTAFALTHWTCLEELEVFPECNKTLVLRPKQGYQYSCVTNIKPKNTEISSLSCVLRIGVKMDLYSFSRLPITFIEQNYSWSLQDLGFLTKSEVPAIVTLGPIKLNINTEPQPIDLSEENRTMYIFVSSGRADIASGEVTPTSYYLLLPRELGNCLPEGDFSAVTLDKVVGNCKEKEVREDINSCGGGDISFLDISFHEDGYLFFKPWTNGNSTTLLYVRIDVLSQSLNYNESKTLDRLEVSNLSREKIEIKSVNFSSPKTFLKAGSPITVRFSFRKGEREYQCATTSLKISPGTYCRQFGGELNSILSNLTSLYNYNLHILTQSPKEFKLYTCPIKVNKTLLESRVFKSFLIYAVATYTYLTYGETTVSCSVI